MHSSSVLISPVRARQAKVTPASVIIQGQQDLDVSLQAIMAFEFNPLVHRMIDKYGWSEVKAVQVFEDTKRFLYLCGISTDGSLSPPEVVDDMWHNFILFTEDYLKFCKTHFGRFIHHRPRQRDDALPTGNPVRNTLIAATRVFGKLSSNWEFQRSDGTRVTVANLVCSNGCCDAEGSIYSA
jgi:hypothetical protein